MNFRAKNAQVVHEVVHKSSNLIVIDAMSKKYTTPKLYTPKDEKGKPTVDPGKYWYVYFYFVNPATSKKKQFRYKFGINKLKTVKERKELGKAAVKSFSGLLEKGWSPFENNDITFNISGSITIEKALKDALEQKKSEWKQSTAVDMENRINTFLEWLRKNELLTVFAQDINRKHIVAFLNDISKKASNRSVNNYKGAISSLFTKMVEDGVLLHNVVLSIKKRKTIPKRHKPFSTKELKKVKSYLLENDSQLYYFMCFVGYAFLRNREVCKLKVKDVDLQSSMIYVETKSSNLDGLRIIDTLKPIVEKMKLKHAKREHYIFTPEGSPGNWNISLNDKVGYFGSRFLKVKEKLKLDSEHTIYSMRHTMAVNIYNNFIAQGYNERETILKMLPITRHSSEQSLRNYLRNVNAYIPKDYSSNISIDF